MGGKVRLAGPEGLAQLEGALDAAIGDVLQAKMSNDGMRPEQADIVRAKMAQMKASLLDKLAGSIIAGSRDSQGQENAAPAAAGPASPPPDDAPPAYDDESAALELELASLAAAVAQHRAAGPAVLAARLRAQLQGLQLPAEPAEGPEADAALPSAPATDGAAAPEELRGALAAAAGALPGLRARLESALDRLGRVIGAVEAERARPTPGTIERALSATPVGDGTSPIELATASGKIATRRRVARHLRPVPYSGGGLSSLR